MWPSRREEAWLEVGALFVGSVRLRWYVELFVAIPFGRVCFWSRREGGVLVVSRLESWWCHVGASRWLSSRRDKDVRRVAIAVGFLSSVFALLQVATMLSVSR